MRVCTCVIVCSCVSLQTLVIPAAEWMRIQENLSGTNRQEQALRATQNERETLRNKSKAMVKDWANTIEVSVSCGQRCNCIGVMNVL